MADLGRTLFGLGLGLALVGLVLMVVGRFGGLPLGLGRLPGDILIERQGFRLYFPITSSVVVSVILSLLLYFLRR